MENNRECYHCTANHPELTVSLFAVRFRLPAVAETNASEVQAFKDLIKTEHARWESCGLPSRELEHLDVARHRLPHRAPAHSTRRANRRP